MLNVESYINEEHVKIVKLEGRLTTDNALWFDKEVESVLGVNSICIDFCGLDYMSSAGLRILLHLRKRFKGTICLSNLNDTIYEILRVTGFDSMFSITRCV